MAEIGHLHAATTVTLRKNDAEPLTRADVQYDLLNYLFADNSDVFTDHTALYEQISPPQPLPRVTFRRLYIDALLQSGKLSGVVKDRMTADHDFALEFAKIALLVNVGRINTTMAFFPDMKTALRTYNPIPSLQKTEGNAQDAPRIKSALKGAFLPFERSEGRASNVQELRRQMDLHGVPPCSITNLIFILSSDSESAVAGPDRALFTFPQLFCAADTSSVSRAKAILWLLFYYLEGPNAANPFSDSRRPDTPPELRPMDAEESRNGNRDTPQEIEWGNIMRARRSQFLQSLVKDDQPEASAIPEHVIQSVASSGRKRRHNSKTRHAQDAASHADANRRARAEGFVREPLWATTGVAPVPRAPPAEYPPQPRQSMLQYALQGNHRYDPLAVSDGEDDTIHTRWDYEQRLGVLNRLLRANPPSPQMNLQPDVYAR